jgi:hypothetical protein
MPTPAYYQRRSNRFANISSSRHHFLRFFAELAVEARMIVLVHPTLKCLRGGRSIKEASRDAQRADPVTSSPDGTNLVSFANAFHQHGALEQANLPMI